MYAPTQLPPPSNWQDFQELCRVLWKYVWSLSDEDIIAYGDNGDKQDGVDICAIVGEDYYGIQCKSKDQLKEKQITIAEIEVGELLRTIDYDYPAFHLTMHCFKCKLSGSHVTLLEHEAAKWLKAKDLDSVKWLPADEEIINELKH